MLNKILILLLFSFMFILSCSETDNKTEEPQNDKIEEELVEFPSDTFSVTKINYKVIIPETQAQRDSLINKYSSTDKDMVYKKILKTLNRKELYYMRSGSKIIVPDTIIDDLRAYSVFPQYYHGAAKLEKLVVVDNKMQCYACYEYGKLIRFAAANTGKERTPTFPGRYSMNWKKKDHRSSIDSNWHLPYTFNFHSQAGSAFHQFEMPGRPVSHSCVRQFLDDAEWLFNWGQRQKYDSLGKPLYMSGTPVIIVNMFDYSRKKGGPWLDINSNKEGIVQLPKDPMEVEEALIPIVQIPKQARGGLRNIKRYIYAEDTLRARGIIREGVHLIQTVDFNKERRIKNAKKEKERLEKEKLEQEKSINENEKVNPKLESDLNEEVKVNAENEISQNTENKENPEFERNSQ